MTLFTKANNMSPSSANTSCPPLPKQHDPIPESISRPFGEWLNQQLAALEQRYESYVTRSSVQESLDR